MTIVLLLSFLQMAFSYVLFQVMPAVRVSSDTPSSPVQHISNILFGQKRYVGFDLQFLPSFFVFWCLLVPMTLLFRVQLLSNA